MILSDVQWYIIFFAFIMDFILGDPLWLPHPVVFMGKAIEKAEPFFRKIIKNQFISGFWFALSLIFLTWFVTFLVLKLCFLINPFFAHIIEIILLFFCLSAKTLEKAAWNVADSLKNSGLSKARKKLAMIVGRDVNSLDKTGVIRAVIETVAENFVDGFLSPLFFALIGGIPFAMAYKMINTLDSMVGYNNKKYSLFGRTAARIDDAANFIPARIAVFIISFAAYFLSGKKKSRNAFKYGFKEGRLHKSPNSGYAEASFAGALMVKLGGPNYYGGIFVEKPFIGKKFKDPDVNKITMACDLMLLSSFISVILSLLFLFFMKIS